MEIVEIINQFECASGRFERATVEAAVARREEITPELLRSLDDTVRRAAELGAEGDYMAHLYAMFLLAQFREVRAYPLVVRFALLPGDLLDSLCGDFITEDLGRVLASVCGGELDGIQSIIENEDADEFVRGAAVSSLVTLVAAGQKTREEIVSYFATLLRVKLARKWSRGGTDGRYRTGLRGGSGGPRFIGFGDVKRDFGLGKSRVLARLADNRNQRMVEDTVREMERWVCFRENEGKI